MTQVEQGSRWYGNARDFYHVVSVVDIDGQTWVHYRRENPSAETHNVEFSCHLESFLSRFSRYENTSR